MPEAKTWQGASGQWYVNYGDVEVIVDKPNEKGFSKALREARELYDGREAALEAFNRAKDNV